jgi:hypothetical protein
MGAFGSASSAQVPAVTAAAGVESAANSVLNWVDTQGLAVVNPWLPPDPARSIYNALSGALPYFLW